MATSQKGTGALKAGGYLVTKKYYQVIIKKGAIKDIAALPKPYKKKVSNKIDLLKTNPRPRGAQPVKNFGENGYRIRVGDYRILYQINDRKIEVLVVRIRHRREAYRNL